MISQAKKYPSNNLDILSMLYIIQTVKRATRIEMKGGDSTTKKVFV